MSARGKWWREGQRMRQAVAERRAAALEPMHPPSGTAPPPPFPGAHPGAGKGPSDAGGKDATGSTGARSATDAGAEVDAGRLRATILVPKPPTKSIPKLVLRARGVAASSPDETGSLQECSLVLDYSRHYFALPTQEVAAAGCAVRWRGKS